MAWPPSDIGTSNTDAGTDSPQAARADILGLMQGFNLLRNHFSTFMQGLSEAANATQARAALGAAAIEPGATYPVGCLIFAVFTNASGGFAARTLAYGETTAGSDLNHAGVGANIPGTSFVRLGSGQSPGVGVWRCLGRAEYQNGVISMATLWQRVS